MTHLWVFGYFGVGTLGRSGLSPEHEITPPEAAQAEFGRFTM